MLENGATRQQIADVVGVGVKTIYKYFPVGTHALAHLCNVSLADD